MTEGVLRFFSKPAELVDAIREVVDISLDIVVFVLKGMMTWAG